MGGAHRIEKEKKGADPWHPADAPVQTELTPAQVPNAPVHGAGQNPAGAGALFRGQYDAGTPDAAPRPRLEPPSLEVGGYKVSVKPVGSTDNRYDNAQFRREAEEREQRERDAQRHGDKPYDPIGDRLRGPAPPKKSPATDKADGVIADIQRKLNETPDGGVPAEQTQGVRKRYDGP